MRLKRELEATFKNKKVLILGLGLLGGGVGVTRFLVEHGAKVVVTDLKKENELRDSIKLLNGLAIKYVLGRHRRQDILWSDLIIRNPAVDWHSPLLQLAVKKKIPIEMEVGLFIKLAGERQIIGVTGTRGKSTTTAMIVNILRAGGYHTVIGGNIAGQATLPLLYKLKKESKIVLELSSWQLQALSASKISPHLAVITNIYPDHLNRYASMKEYVNDKKAIFAFQNKNDCLILNKEDSTVRSFAHLANGRVLFFQKSNLPNSWHLKVAGEHNRANAAAALKVGCYYQIKKKAIRQALETLRGLPYRLEEIARIEKITFVNDTTSTTPTAGMMALKTYGQRPIILIAGGNSKKLAIGEFVKMVAKKVKAVVLLAGNATANFKAQLRQVNSRLPIYGPFADLAKGVKIAYQMAIPGDIILLSPGFTSFGSFQNEFDRGDKFNEAVKKLKTKNKKHNR